MCATPVCHKTTWFLATIHSWIIVIKIKNSIPPQRKRSCVCITQTNLLVLNQEIIVFYSENHTKTQRLYVAKIQSFSMLKQPVHTATNVTTRRNPAAVRNVLFSSYLCYCKYTRARERLFIQVCGIYSVLFSEHEIHGRGEQLWG
jgi:hypothetical protein